MEINEKLSKLIFQEFDDSIKGTDIYNHDGSMWLIFTEERKWVVEFTKTKTLWYNYKHFNDTLILFGMELSKGAEYIKKWYENRFIFGVIKQNVSTLLYVDDVIDNGVKNTDGSHSNYRLCVENTIQNGVKHTAPITTHFKSIVEDTIENGVKKVDDSIKERLFFVEDTIKNGVKYVLQKSYPQNIVVEDTIQNGVKDTNCKFEFTSQGINDAIKIGFKDTDPKTYQPNDRIEDVVENGVNVISWAHPTANFTNQVDGIIQNGVKNIYCGCNETLPTIEDTIQNGVKDMWCIERTNTFDVEDTIQNGIKNTQSFDGKSLKLVNKIISDGVKRTEWNGSDLPTGKVEDTIQNGVKDVKEIYEYSLSSAIFEINCKNVIKKGVKDVFEGEIQAYLVDDVIEDGVKEVEYYDGDVEVLVNDAIENGVKYMMSGSEFKNNQVEDVIKYSVKL
jgi:hypothetical protein